VINEIFKCYGDTFHLLATMRLPPSPPAIGSSKSEIPECSQGVVVQNGWIRASLRRVGLLLAISAAIHRLRFAENSSGVTMRPTKIV
jgi:hypothetical protein